jgi:hypothetical protein
LVDGVEVQFTWTTAGQDDLVMFLWVATEEGYLTPQVIVTSIGQYQAKGFGVKLNHGVQVLAKKTEMGQLCVGGSIHIGWWCGERLQNGFDGVSIFVSMAKWIDHDLVNLTRHAHRLEFKSKKPLKVFAL